MTVAELRNLFDEARPLVRQWLDLSEQFAAFRDAATDKGFDWSQIKALLKAQAQDERDGGSKYVARIIQRAEFASSYAAMLGLGEMNENNYSDTERGEPREAEDRHGSRGPRTSKPEAPPMETTPQMGPSGTAATDDEDVPTYLQRGHPDNSWVRQ